MALFSFGASSAAGSSDHSIDTSRRRLITVGCACCLGMMWAPGEAAAQSPEVLKHLDLAEKAAGTDLLTYLKLGDSARPGYKGRSMSVKELMEMPSPPPGKAFDNLYFVGSKWVTTWAIPTSEGIILIDAMDNEDEAERIVAQGMRKLGLDPRQVRTVVVTHGHGDHYGGAEYFKRLSNAQIVMSAADWSMTETKLEFDHPFWGRPPKRDVSVNGGDFIRLGGTSLEIISTPGHTMGTLSLLFPVKLGAETHLALLWGGTAFNFGRQVARMNAYIESVDRVRDIAKQRGVDVFISNHNTYDEAVAKLSQMDAGKKNPFVLGVDTAQRALTVMSECAKASLASWNA